METRDTTSRALAVPDIVRLWVIGGTNNVVRWLELLSSALFTYELTHSGLMVAGVTAARTLPMLLFGAFAGVLSEAINRKRIMQTGMVVTAVTSAIICALALTGLARPWHIALSNFICGTVWSAEMSSRRRMVGDSAAPGMLSRVIAVDSLAGASTRMIGPLVGGIVYDLVGLPGAYALTLLLSLVNFALAWPLTHHQVSQKLALGTAARDLLEGVRTAIAIPQVAAVLAVTIAMNAFVFCYSALVAPIALTLFRASTAQVGLMGAAESAGALLAGLLLARGIPRLAPRVMMIGGSALFAGSLALMPLIPSFTLACLILLIGGSGTAAFSNMQTMLVLNGAPPAMRSRMLGLITVCIGTGPLGQLVAGALADTLGLRPAVEILALLGLTTILGIGWIWRRAARITPGAGEA
jgi:MFS family permease